MTRYLLDTNIISELVRNPHGKAARRGRHQMKRRLRLLTDEQEIGAGRANLNPESGGRALLAGARLLIHGPLPR